MSSDVQTHERPVGFAGFVFGDDKLPSYIGITRSPVIRIRMNPPSISTWSVWWYNGMSLEGFWTLLKSHHFLEGTWHRFLFTCSSVTGSWLGVEEEDSCKNHVLWLGVGFKYLFGSTPFGINAILHRLHLWLVVMRMASEHRGWRSILTV